MRIILTAFVLLLVSTISSVSWGDSNDKVKQEIIKQSIRNYSGNCPCPYNRDRAGRKCGKRSAYSKPGGYSPVCYPSDVTDSMIRDYNNK